LILAHDFLAGELFNPRRLSQEKDQLSKKTKWNAAKRMSTSESKFVPHSHILQCPEGSGYYSDNELGCYDVIFEAVPLVLDVIKSATVEPGSVFTICDYGCADGGTSMTLLYACVQELRKIHGDDVPLSVIYEDQPVNDFKSLFLRLQGLIPGPKSYFLDFPNVFVTACGTNFFDECFPPQSVNLGFSSMAFHWLSRKPCDITGALHQPMITVKDEAEKFEEQAAKDWETILLARAKELAPGSP